MNSHLSLNIYHLFDNYDTTIGDATWLYGPMGIRYDAFAEAVGVHHQLCYNCIMGNIHGNKKQNNYWCKDMQMKVFHENGRFIKSTINTNILYCIIGSLTCSKMVGWRGNSNHREYVKWIPQPANWSNFFPYDRMLFLTIFGLWYTIQNCDPTLGSAPHLCLTSPFVFLSFGNCFVEVSTNRSWTLAIFFCLC